tara:strand:+ start:648 stop:1220 length:573 start_codon:yes stop_codon:yes gene_type:complete
MKSEYLIFGIAAFFIADTYHQGKYSRMLKSGKKYYQMALIGFLAFSFYLFLKKNPHEGRNIMSHANTLIRHAPIEQHTADMLSPIFDFTGGYDSIFSKTVGYMPPQEKRMMNSGMVRGSDGRIKRSVSETKKKYVASQQGWKCHKCTKQLEATFEVDHVVSLEDGGSNHIDNLEALCRECHGRKTMMSNL